MKGIVSNHLSNRRMPTGRHVFAFKQMKEKAQERGLSDIVDYLDQCIEQGYETLRIEFAYEQSRDGVSSARGRAAQLDNELDSLIGSIEQLVRARETGPEDDPVRKASERVQSVIFPRGVAAIIHQSFENQLGVMKMMLEQFRGELSDEVSLLAIEREVDLFEKLVGAFEDELQSPQVPVTTFDQVSEARERLHEYASMAEVLILSKYPSLDEDGSRKRESLLKPYVDQQQRVYEEQRRNRVPRDIDPDTGDELMEDEQPTPVNDGQPPSEPVDEPEPDVDMEPAG